MLLVLDEPTAAMDVQARRNFWRQIHAFAGRGRTVLFATHYLHEADDAADRVVVIAGGRKIADGPPAAIKAAFGDQQVRFTLLHGSPARLAALDGVRAVEHDHSRVTLHSTDTDATVRSLAGSGLAWSGLEVGGPDLETSFLRLLEKAHDRFPRPGAAAFPARRPLPDTRGRDAGRAVPAVRRPVRRARPAR